MNIISINYRNKLNTVDIVNIIGTCIYGVNIVNIVNTINAVNTSTETSSPSVLHIFMDLMDSHSLIMPVSATFISALVSQYIFFSSQVK